MIPKSLSASAIASFVSCPSRYKAEWIERVPSIDGSAALLGTTCHSALEDFVESGEAVAGEPVEVLLKHFTKHYWTNFATDDRIDEGLEMMRRWHDRQDWSDRTVISTEAKECIFIHSSVGPIQFNFILDRMDQLANGDIEVVDYKGLDVNTPIATPDGWSKMGDLQVGDKVYGGDGQPCRIVGKSQIHNKKCFQITFDDNSTVVCDDEHRWLLQVGSDEPAVWTAQELADRGIRSPNKKGQRDVRIPTVSLQGDDIELPIDPYVLGCWLGDGSAACGVLTKPFEPMFDEIRARGYEVGPVYTRQGGRTVMGLRTQLRVAGLLDNKHIPAIYYRASRAQRLDLLRGLMDADGHWNPLRKRCVMVTTATWQAEAISELVVSLGWKATTFDTVAKAFNKNWAAKQVWFTAVDHCPFLTRVHPDYVSAQTPRSSRRMVTEIVEVPSVSTQCIQVDSPNHTFLAGPSLVMTHNSNWVPMTFDDLRSLTQPQMYGMVARLKYPNVKRIWVRFDFLRHDSIAIEVTREQNRATWEYLKLVTEQIIESDGTEEKIGKDCGWCIRRQTCATLNQHILAGGPLAVTLDIETAARRRMELFEAQKAMKTMISELDEALTNHMEHEGMTEFETPEVAVSLSGSRRRKVNGPVVAAIVGQDIYSKYAEIAVGKTEQMLKDEPLTPEQATEVSKNITWAHTSVGVKVKAKGPLDPGE